MQISKYYRSGHCSELARFDNLMQHDGIELCRLSMLEVFCSMLSLSIDTDKILSQLRSQMEKMYQDNWFTFPWQKEQTIKNDVIIYKRFISWFKEVFKILSNSL